MKQHAFSFNFEAHLRDDDFIVSECNADALSMIEYWPEWSSNTVYIYGDKSCGKSHLASIWKNKSNAVIINNENIKIYNEQPKLIKSTHCFIIDGVENISDEVALFHLFNSIKESSGFLLLTSEKHPSAINWQLPDLESRINSVLTFFVGAPDDALIEILIAKSFADRQLQVEYNVISYLMKNIKRSFEDIFRTVERIDRLAIEKRSNITIPFIRSIID